MPSEKSLGDAAIPALIGLIGLTPQNIPVLPTPLSCHIHTRGVMLIWEGAQYWAFARLRPNFVPFSIGDVTEGDGVRLPASN